MIKIKFITLILFLYIIDKSFGFDIAIEEAQPPINATHVEEERNENCIGLVKLMGRNSGKFCKTILNKS